MSTADSIYIKQLTHFQSSSNTHYKRADQHLSNITYLNLKAFFSPYGKKFHCITWPKFTALQLWRTRTSSLPTHTQRAASLQESVIHISVFCMQSSREWWWKTLAEFSICAFLRYFYHWISFTITPQLVSLSSRTFLNCSTHGSASNSLLTGIERKRSGTQTIKKLWSTRSLNCLRLIF